MHPTGKSVARLRRKQGLSVAQFAAQLGVSPATVYRWEATQGSLNLQARLLNALTRLQQRAKKGIV
jgi:DNA-binding transcriptional regulator YiaG